MTTPEEGESTPLQPGDLHLLTISSVDQVKEYVEKYRELRFPTTHYAIFVEQLTQRRDSWFVDAGGEGLIYLTNVVPRCGATLSFVFWDNKLSADRREAIRSTVVTAFDLFELPRIASLCPYNGNALEKNPLAMTLKKVGFVLEGVVRKGYTLPNGAHCDMVLYGVTDDEVKTWPVVPMTISSVRR